MGSLFTEAGLRNSDLYALRMVRHQLAVRQSCYQEPLEISVKLSPRTMEREDICEQIGEILKEYPNAVSWLRILITDSAQINRRAVFLDNCRRLAAAGLKLSLSGYGSSGTDNSLIRERCFDEIRIDESLTEQIESRTMDFLTVMVILDLCRTEGKRVVAQGICREAQCRTVRGLGCGLIEGAPAGAAQAAEQENL